MKNRWKTPLPIAVRLQAEEADGTIAEYKDYRELNKPWRGAPRAAGNYKRPPIITGFDVDNLNHRLETLKKILGPHSRGNVRWGRVAFYADLMDEFERLNELGIIMPGNGHLSAKACQHGLGDVLRNHGHTKSPDAVLIRSGRERQRIAKKLHSAFTRVRRQIKNTPLKIT